MNKIDFIEALKEEAGLTKNEAKKLVNLFFDEMVKELTKGERVEICGLCSFYVK